MNPPSFATTLFFSAAALLLSFPACTRRDEPEKRTTPIVSGQIVQVELGDKPVLRGGETGSWTAKTFYAGWIEIYPTCIVVTEPDGTKHAAPPERFGMVRLK